jgi:hypothetical protein
MIENIKFIQQNKFIVVFIMSATFIISSLIGYIVNSKPAEIEKFIYDKDYNVLNNKKLN